MTQSANESNCEALFRTLSYPRPTKGVDSVKMSVEELLKLCLSLGAAGVLGFLLAIWLRNPCICP